MKKIDFFIQNLEGGGAERVILNIINNLNRGKFISRLILIENKGVYLKDLNRNLTKITFKNKVKNRKLSYVFSFIKSMIFLKKEKRIIFTQYHPGKLLSFFIPIFFKNRKIIYRETSIPQKINQVSKNEIKILDKWFYKYGIIKFSTVIAQSDHMKKKLLELNPKLKNKIFVINNFIDFNFITEKIKEMELIKNKNNYEKYLKLIAIGRLSKEKGFDILINSLSKIDMDFKLQILGDGPEKNYLNKLIKEKKLENKIFLKGFKENPFIELINSDFLISSSIFEGFPNVVLEANACGIPVISNYYEGAIEEIIESGINGEVIDISDVNQLKNALKKKYNKKLIIKKIKMKYDKSKIIKEYENLLTD